MQGASQSGDIPQRRLDRIALLGVSATCGGTGSPEA